MLYYSTDPPSSGFALNLGNSDLPPPEFHETTPEEYLGYLRAEYRHDPRPFVTLASEARDRQITLYSVVRPELVEVLYGAIVAVADRRGWSIAGGGLAQTAKNLSGRYVP